VAGVRAVGKLPDDGEDVRPVFLLQVGIPRGGRLEVYELEPGAVDAHPTTQYVQRPALLDLLVDFLDEPIFCLRPKLLLQLLPLLRLRRNDEVEEVIRDQAPFAIVVRRVALPM